MLSLLKKERIYFVLLFLLCVFLIFNKHSKDKANSYHGVIWADAAGYYVYAPMWFIYDNHALNFPDSIEVKTGNGFQLDFINNKINTKYYCGTAILETPFFLISHALAKLLGFKADGFSKIYSFGLFFSGIFYCCMGLFLVSKFLRRHFSIFISVATPLLFLAGSNLYYYTIDAPGMSHVYSFFLFCSIIYLTPLLLSKPNFKYYILFFCCLVLAVLTRPTNILIGLFPLFYSVKNKNDFSDRIHYLLKNKMLILLSVLPSLILAIPQLIYWYSKTGNFITYSYGTETFSFWKNPKLLEVWFSTNNGLFTYTPLIAICLLGVVLMIKQKEWLGFFTGILFLIISYIFSSWWNWWFGCAFGARSFVEYYAIFCIPLAYLLEYTLKHKYYRYIMILAIVFCCYLNMNMEYYYDGCFYGDTWDMTSYLKLLHS